MKVILTGSSGRIGRAIFAALTKAHDVVGIDIAPSPFTQIIGDIGNIGDDAALDRAMDGADAIIHTAALHAPHVGLASEREFERVNVEATLSLYAAARKHGLKRFVFTSTTALYGNAISSGTCTWIDEETEPQPRTIYHKTKLAAERCLMGLAAQDLPVHAIRMSRCFPEPADMMAVYRLHRGIDARDVAAMHDLALSSGSDAWQCTIASAPTPFTAADCEALGTSARDVIWNRAPELAQAFEDRGWMLPKTIDRVYSPAKAEAAFGWKARHDWREVLAQSDRADRAVLSPMEE